MQNEKTIEKNKYMNSQRLELGQLPGLELWNLIFLIVECMAASEI